MTCDMGKDRLLTLDFVLIIGIALVGSITYFCLFINIVEFTSSQFDTDSSMGGLAAGLYVIGALLSRLLLGKYAELVGRRRMLLGAVILGAAMCPLYNVSSQFAVFCLIRLVHGMSYGLIVAVSTAIASSMIPDSRKGEGLGYFMISSTAGTAIGLLVGMSVGLDGGYWEIFALSFLLYVAAMVMTLLLKVKEVELTQEEIQHARGFHLRDLVSIAAVPLGLTGLVFCIGYAGISTFIQEYAKEIGLTVAATYFSLFLAAGTLISRMISGKVQDRKGPNAIIIPAFFLYEMGLLMFALAESAVMLLTSGLLIGFGMSTFCATSLSEILRQSPGHEYSRVSSTYGALADSGTGIGAYILGAIIPFTGIRGMFMSCLLIAAIAMVMYWAVFGNSHRGQTATWP